MTDPNNAMRAEAARQALEAVPSKYGAVDEDAVVDLIADLLHLGNREGYAASGVLLARAAMNFDAEVKE